MGEIVNLMPSRKRIALIAHDNCKGGDARVGPVQPWHIVGT